MNECTFRIIQASGIIFTAICAGTTAVCAVKALALAKIRWGFDKDKHDKEVLKERRAFIEELVRVHQSSPDNAGSKIGSKAQSLEELQIYMMLLKEELAKHSGFSGASLKPFVESAATAATTSWHGIVMKHVEIKPNK